MGASASRVREKRASVSRPRRLQVMVKTIRLRTRPSGQKKQNCVRYVMKSSNSKVAVSRRQSLLHEEPGGEAKPDDDCKMKVHGEADSHRK